jgi:hypothetical protein
VEVPLTFDAQFFDILLDDVTSLDTLQAEEQKLLGDEIIALSTEVTAVTKYGKLRPVFRGYFENIELLTENSQAQEIPKDRHV